jgi:hypothetical protein
LQVETLIIGRMKYINDTVRRQDRLMDEERAREILKTAEYGIRIDITDFSGKCKKVKHPD